MNCLNDFREDEFIDSLDAAISVAEDLVSDLCAYNVGDGFSRTLLGTKGCLDGIVVAIGFDLDFSSYYKAGLLVDIGLAFECGCCFFGFEQD